MSDLQRMRLLDATFAVVAEDGYKRLTARRISGRAGVSNKTFYDLFSDGEDCFLAAFDYAVQELAAVVLPAYQAEREWPARIRAGLGVLLGFLDGEPALRRLVFVEVLAAGPRVLERRAGVLEVLRGAIDEGRTGLQHGRVPVALTAEGIVGAAFGVIHARLLEPQPEPLRELLGPLMAMIVLPYRGHTVAERELTRPTPTLAPESGSAAPRHGPPSVRPAGAGSHLAGFRLTQRTQMVLTAIAEMSAGGSNPNNREVADAADISDQGQISKLLARLEGIGLLQNTGGETQGIPRAWRLTTHGKELLNLGRNQRAPVLVRAQSSSTGNPHPDARGPASTQTSAPDNKGKFTNAPTGAHRRV